MGLGLTGPRNAGVSQSEKKKREKGGRSSLYFLFSSSSEGVSRVIKSNSQSSISNFPFLGGGDNCSATATDFHGLIRCDLSSSARSVYYSDLAKVTLKSQPEDRP